MGVKGAQLALQGGGAVVVLIFSVWVIRAKTIRLPFERSLLDSKDLQVFAALLICFGLAAATGALELSSAIGAFLAGLLVSKASATQWVHHSLEPFRVVFVALFFVSIGLLVDLEFIQEHWWVIGVLVLGAYGVNTLINAVTLRFFGIPWRECWYIGALLAQIGEFSFVLAALGLKAGAITQHGYQLTICVIILSLLFSPLWVFVVKRVARPRLV